MSPHLARGFTQSLLNVSSDKLRHGVASLYLSHPEFAQYVDRFISRFEAQIKQLMQTKNPDLERFKTSEVAKLYAVLAQAVGH